MKYLGSTVSRETDAKFAGELGKDRQEHKWAPERVNKRKRGH